MLPFPTEHLDPDSIDRPLWVRSLDLIVSAVIVCAVALIGCFLSATSAHAQQGKWCSDIQPTVFHSTIQ